MLYDVFLLSQGFERKCMGKSTALPSVVLVVRHGQSGNTRKIVHRSDVDRRLVHVYMPLAMPVDVFPSLGGVECQFIGAHPNDGSYLC
jgi:hypothetical protein